MNYLENRLLKFSLVLLFILFIYKIKGILLPFIVGFIIAFLFKDLVKKYETKINRSILSLVIISVFSILIIALSIFIFPKILAQLASLFTETIKHIQNIDKDKSQIIITNIFKKFGVKEAKDIQNYINSVMNTLVKWLMSLTNSLLLSSFQLVNVIFMVCISPIVAFYFLKDWEKMFLYFESYILPKNYRDSFNDLATRINDVLHHYIIGQTYVCLIFSIFYCLTLKLLGINYALVVGIISGVAIMLPYIGSFGTAIMALIVTYFQFGFQIKKLSFVLFFYCLGQFLEGNFITPSVIGNKMQVHPMWMLFGVFSCGSLFGTWGIILSVPLIGVLGVIIRFFIEQKRKVN